MLMGNLNSLDIYYKSFTAQSKMVKNCFTYLTDNIISEIIEAMAKRLLFWTNFSLTRNK